MSSFAKQAKFSIESDKNLQNIVDFFSRFDNFFNFNTLISRFPEDFDFRNEVTYVCEKFSEILPLTEQ